MGKVYGYCRVSTKGQLENNSLQQQEEEIKSRYEECTIFREAYTGTKTDRPILKKMLFKLEKGDTLVVTKLDRLARNTIEGIEIIQELFQKGIAVHVLDRKSTRLNSSHANISYAVFCLKKKNKSNK